MATQLPTFTSATWTVTSLCDSLRSEIAADRHCSCLRLFAYAVTDTGWRELRSIIRPWLNGVPDRTAVAYVGTDHGLTEPDALRAMQGDGLALRLMRTYHGTFHPKVFWLSGHNSHLVWVGSNNLTREGLLHNIEFATLIKSNQNNPELDLWFQNVHVASELLNEALLTSYEGERRAFAAKRASVGTFTWSKREDPAPPAGGPQLPRPVRTRTRPQPRLARRPILSGHAGDLIVEVMPRETGLDGKQMQLPKAAAVRFFGLRDRTNASRQITLTPVGTTDTRTLTMTLFGNNTARLSINELDYRDRPCVIVFHPQGQGDFEFEIVQRSIFPGRYRTLLIQCGHQTRFGSRRWTIL